MSFRVLVLSSLVVTVDYMMIVDCKGNRCVLEVEGLRQALDEKRRRSVFDPEFDQTKLQKALDDEEAPDHNMDQEQLVYNPAVNTLVVEAWRRCVDCWKGLVVAVRSVRQQNDAALWYSFFFPSKVC